MRTVEENVETFGGESRCYVSPYDCGNGQAIYEYNLSTNRDLSKKADEYPDRMKLYLLSGLWS